MFKWLLVSIDVVILFTCARAIMTFVLDPQEHLDVEHLTLSQQFALLNYHRDKYYAVIYDEIQRNDEFWDQLAIHNHID